jgi:hypothetical protein
VIEKLTPYLGWAGLAFGIITAVCAPLPDFAKLTFICMAPGLLLSSFYIMFSSKYRIETKWINPGFVGIFLSSAPILLAVYYSLTK